MLSAVAAASALAALVPAEAALDRLVIVSRHGEREQLWKHHATQAEALAGEGGPPLTAQGVAHLRAVGNLLRDRYTRPTCVPELCLKGAVGDRRYDASKVRVESSGLERTLGSAYALQAGLFPAGSVSGSANSAYNLPVPVYSRPDAEDYLLRAYTKCTLHAESVAKWHSSEEFQLKASESQAFRSRIAAAIAAGDSGAMASNFNNSALESWWNWYDFLAVAAQEGKPLVSSTDLAQAETLAAWLESHKFGKKIAGKSCGGTLLSEISRRLEDSSGPRLVHYSAHYPTMLCLLTALGVSIDSGHAEDAWLGEGLLGLGSVLAFEVSVSSKSDPSRVHLRYFSGDSSSSWRDIRLRGENGSCPLSEFATMSTANGLPSLGAWCAACQNHNRAMCASRACEGSPGQGSGKMGGQSSGTANQRWDLPAVAFVVMGIGGSLFAGAACYAFRRSLPCFRGEEHSRFIEDTQQRGIGATCQSSV
eukprot:TRINITY_DN51188_c0_g1_i1.p1 TRINITY_DN51188_c0_g1~~TRINITY_DN51188_c0_g1_i1.p1  ORF type:complete len:497 (+),score=74.59 TRINITY_DN51188_c0_g1_i1:59-1492(+)